ncbi:hypothetical protein MKZ38_001370 [Zalerion maritima]|uniref:NAD(P)-binding domain-containing protein n=1 Tax=Zalerion maritima TaxID=339359 RepID=A0AAD5WT65_9PEZI|nr:hypothetical protein MKZ38_001370 [Zalerion maritima]
MAESKKMLVFGGTGPLGICLLRELLHREHATIAYARNPSKIPEDLASNPLLEVIKGEFTDVPALSLAISKASLILSCLGPVLTQKPKSDDEYRGYYATVVDSMREHGVRRIFALSTISAYDEADGSSFLRWAVVWLVRTLFNRAWRNIVNVAEFFAGLDSGGGGGGEGESAKIDWTLYRVAGIPGGCDEQAWRKDREDGKTFVGYVGKPGWTGSQRRAALARWLVDAAESGAEELVGKMLAVSRLEGS